LFLANAFSFSVWRDIEPMDVVWDDVCLKAMDRDEWKVTGRTIDKSIFNYPNV